MDGPGQYAGGRPPGKHSFAMEKGKHVQYYSSILSKLTHPSVLRYSVLPALSLEEGILHCDIVEGAFDTASFYKFIEHTLDHMQPFPAPNSVIVMDNCRIHKHSDILDLIKAR